MIDVIPLGKQDSEEHKAANQLRDLIAEAWPQVADDRRHRVKIFSEVHCKREKRVDLDLVVFINLWKPILAGVTDDGKEAYVKDLWLTIEVKDHHGDKIFFKGEDLYVKYQYPNGKVVNASRQAREHWQSLSNYLGKRGHSVPWITYLLWMRNVSEIHLLKEKHNVLGNEASWETFLQRICNNSPLRWNRALEKHIVGGVGLGKDDTARAYEEFTKVVYTASPLERWRIEGITREAVRKDQRYRKKLGEQLLIFRGRGGAGKTVTLLRLAHQIYSEFYGSTLVLTYNKTLVADIRRLLDLMEINQGFSDRKIRIETVHWFMGKILRESGICEGEDPYFFENYRSYLEDLLEHIRGGAFSKDDIETTDPESFSWDYIMVDEGQDWPAIEREVLFSLYGHRRFVVADGYDQLVRQGSKSDWRRGLYIKESQTVPLRKSLRLKGNLCRFANAFAERMELREWHVEANSEIWGGRIVVVEGPYAKTPELHEQLFEKHKKFGPDRTAENEPIDMLFCIPPKLAKKRVVAKTLEDWDWQVWDGSVEQERGKGPESKKQLRVVTYDSCRGLEGWTVVNLGFDDLYDYKVEEWKKAVEEADLSTSPKQYAAQWLTIPLTRAIDTLVIQVSSADHAVTDALRDVAEECNDFVEWHGK